MKGIKKKSEAVKQDPNQALRELGKKLMKRRKDLGFKNADDFTYETDINRSQYGKYEAGSQDIRFTTLVKIVNSLGLTIEQFFAEGNRQ